MSKFSLRLWLSLNILFLLWVVRPGVLLPSQSRLCESRDMPCKYKDPESCQMKYYKLNSTECKNMIFEKLSSRSVESYLLGNVELKSYYYNILSYKMTAFNVTFSNIKWKHLKFRFRQIGNDMKNTCREFFILPNATLNDLFYDCIWSNETYEGKPFFFEYEASNELIKVYKKFSFHVPFAKNVDETLTHIQDWETFSYVEAVSVSNGLGPTTFFLYWQPLPEKFSVEFYNISVISNDTGNPETVHNLNVTCKNITECSFKYSKWYGTLQFGVQPICTNNISCFTATTLYFQVGGEKAKPVLIGIICATSVVPVALYLLYLMRKYIAMNQVTVMKTIPKVLVIYSSTLSPHVNVVLNLVEYFKNYCNVEPLIDELHIFSSKSRDPFKWCNESFRSADYIMVVPSPSAKVKQISTSVYQNTDLLLLRLLRERLIAHHSKTKFFVLLLPYTSDKDIPEEAQNLRRFYFPRDLNKILRFIHGNRRVLHGLLSCEVQGGRRDYKLYGKKLSSAIEEVQPYLKTKKVENELSVREFGEDGDIGSDHELLTFKRSGSSHFYEGPIRHKESIKEMAKDNFWGYPGQLESINLLGEGDEEAEKLVDFEITAEDCNAININELNL